MHPRATLRGRVVGRGDENGIPHAEIRALVLEDVKPGGIVLHCTSSDDGSFALPVPVASADKPVLVNLRARAKGYAPSGLLGASIQGDAVTPAYTLIRLARGRRLILNLVDRETGRTPAHAEVLAGTRPIFFAFRTSSDESGRAIIDDFPPCKSVYVVVQGGEWVLDTTHQRNVTSTES
ncbi:MAG TPA: hypothetical protein ENK43_06765, partial [Planctomycetes bacterium]|nr:hypothetical protein [Planctomycetota bacterium]